MNKQNFLSNFPHIFQYAENLPNSYQQHEEAIKTTKRFPEFPQNMEYNDSDEEEDFSLFDDTFETLHREAVDLKRKADQLFDLNIISEKEYMEFMTYLERQEAIMKQYDDY